MGDRRSLNLHKCTPLAAISQTLLEIEASGSTLLLETMAGEGDARTRVTRPTPMEQAGTPASRNACAIPDCRAIVPGELGVLCGKQSPAGCTARRLTRRRVWARARAAVVGEKGQAKAVPPVSSAGT
jgi:hypothetical protein